MAEEINNKMLALKNSFNNYSLILSTFLANIAPSSPFGTYHPIMKSLVDEGSNKVIELFILHILTKFEEQILEGNEQFFLGKTYEEELENDSKKVMKVFEFKSLWGNLSEQNKSVIKKYMKLLCEISRVYVNLLCEKKTLNKQSFQTR